MGGRNIIHGSDSVDLLKKKSASGLRMKSWLIGHTLFMQPPTNEHLVPRPLHRLCLYMVLCRIYMMLCCLYMVRCRIYMALPTRCCLMRSKFSVVNFKESSNERK